MTRISRIWTLITVILIGAALRIGMLTDNRFHPDEALFAALARLMISGQDPLLAETGLLVDKPPLFYAVLASGLSICWGCEFAARIPGLIASVISIALVARVAYHLWGSSLGAVAAALVFAMSPFAISFGATAFADPQMIMWLLASLAAISARRVEWGGFFFGLAFATKESAIFALPLIIAIGIVQSAERGTGWREATARVLQFMLALGLVIGAMVVWETIRGSETSFWESAVQANDPGRLIRSMEVLPRVSAWWRWTAYIGGAGWLTAAMGAAIGWLAVVESRERMSQRGAALSLVFIAFGIAYWALNWLVAFPVLDRYMLILVPIVALLVGRALCVLPEVVINAHKVKLRVVMRLGIAGLIGILLAPMAIRAMGSGYPTGGDHGGYDGIDHAAEYLRGLPAGSIVYHNGLGWSLSYYLQDAPVIPVSFDSPGALQRDLETFGKQGGERYLIGQGWESNTEILTAAEEAGFLTSRVLITHNRFGDQSFVIYRLQAVN